MQRINTIIPLDPTVLTRNAPERPGCLARIHMPETGLEVWFARMGEPDSSDTWEALLAPEERDRAGRFRFEQDRRRYVYGRGLLRELVASYLGTNPISVRFDYSSKGKPSLAPSSENDDAVKQGPENHGSENRSLCFNISHSCNLLLLAFAWNRRVGIDVEQIRWDVAAAAIARRFFSPAEQDALLTLEESELLPAFFRCWTRKEAYVKAVGEGLTLPLRQFDVSLLPGQPPALLATRSDAMEANRWTLQDVDAGSGYAAAVAVEKGR